MEGREILLHSAGAATGPGGGTLLIGGIHGDERATVMVLESFMELYLRTGKIAGRIAVIPLANPDSFEHYTRYNARGVDVNRNFETNWNMGSAEPSGPEPWSEPESRALRDLILQEQPARIVSLHWALAEIDADGAQSTELAWAMWDALSESERAPYRVRVWEHAPGRGFTTDVCPGSLGQWCGYHLHYRDGSVPAMITLELPYDPHLRRPEVLAEGHLDLLHRAWVADAPAYMAAVEGPVHKMLVAAASRRRT